MLAPEVWEFDPPSSTLKIQEGVIDSPEKIENLIKSHPFNHLVRVCKTNLGYVAFSSLSLGFLHLILLLFIINNMYLVLVIALSVMFMG